MTDPITFAAHTPRLGLPFLFAGQAQKEFFVNEALGILDTLLAPCADGLVNAPPVDPQVGQCWLVGEAPEGEFAGNADAIACWDGAGFTFATPREGLCVRMASGPSRVFRSGSWLALPAAPEVSGGAVVDHEARGAIATVVEALRLWGVFS